MHEIGAPLGWIILRMLLHEIGCDKLMPWEAHDIIIQKPQDIWWCIIYYIHHVNVFSICWLIYLSCLFAFAKLWPILHKFEQRSFLVSELPKAHLHVFTVVSEEPLIWWSNISEVCIFECLIALSQLLDVPPDFLKPFKSNVCQLVFSQLVHFLFLLRPVRANSYCTSCTVGAV